MAFALPVVLLFLGALTVLGARHARRVRSGADFALAGRSLGAAVLAGTLTATWIGTGSLFGNAEFTYRHGVAGFLLPLPGLVGMLVLAWLAPRVRRVPADSLPQILGLSFGRAARLLAAVTLILAYLVIVSYQYRAGAAVAQRLFPGIASPWLSCGFAAFVILYTALAGMVSVALTDVINGIVMGAGLLIALALLWFRGPAAGDGSVPAPAELWDLGGGLSAFGWINALLPTFLLILGDANLHQRFLAARTPASARRAALGAFLGICVMEWAIIGIALLGRTLLPEPLANPGHVVVETAFQLLPPAVGVLLAATAVAVIVSTADSYLLASSTTLTSDLGPGLSSPGRQRACVVALGLIALALSFTSQSFFRVALYAYTLYGASLTPAVLCALLVPGVPRRAPVWGMAAGLATALLWKVLLAGRALPAALLDLDPVLPALLANLLGILLGCVFSRRRPSR